MTDIKNKIEEEANSETVTYNWEHELFAYMQDEHDVTMLDSDMHEVFDICKKEFEHSSRWRKVSEELPNNGQLVLVKTIDNTYHTASYYANRGDFYSISMYELDDYELFLIDGIVEWKPID